MLSSIGRAAIRRVVAGASHPTSTNRAIQSVWHFRRADDLQDNNSASNYSQIALPTRRSYATTSKTTSAAKPKPKAKKTVIKSETTKKASPKKKPVKQATRKAQPKVVKKKVLTPEKKEEIAARKAAEKARTQLKELKVTALLPQPKALPATAYMVLMTESLVGKPSTASATETMKQAAEKYKSLNPDQLEQYNHRANQNKAANDLAMKKWIESHTPDQIREANNARRLLKRRGLKTPNLLEDARQPKRAAKALSLFVKDRWASGDLKGLKIADAQKVVVGEWKDLPASERKKYEDQEAAEKQRYFQEFKTVFKRDAPAVAA